MIDVEQLRNYCLSLGGDVEEKFPFTKFRGGETVLVFYVCGHMFCYFDIEAMDTATVKCHPGHIAELMARHECITAPYNANPAYWVGIRLADCDDGLLCGLIKDSYDIVKTKYARKPRGKS